MAKHDLDQTIIDTFFFCVNRLFSETIFGIRCKLLIHSVDQSDFLTDNFENILKFV